MSKRPKTLPARVRTVAALKADARLLSGAQSRVARAEAGDDDAPGDESKTVGELWLYGVVGGWWRGFDAESVSRALRAMGDVDVLHVRIHSPGGRADDGVAIANLLRNFNAHVVTIVDGTAASAASVIAVAGDEVVMCPGAQLMLHDASTGMYLWGDAEYLRSQVVELQRVVDWIDGQSQNYAGVYAYKAGGTAEEWRKVMTANGLLGRWYTGEEAVAAKLADRVGTITAAGSPPVAPEDEFDEEDDDLLARVEHDLQLLEQHVHPAARAAWQGQPPKSATAPAPKPPTASADGSITTEGGSAVAFSDEQLTTMRTKLGLAEDADEATILAALDEALDERSEPTSEATIPEGHVVIPKAQLDDLTAGAQLAVKTAKALQDRECKALLDDNRAKFLPTTRAAWEEEFARNPQAVRDHFAKAPDIIPTSELGHADTSEDDAAIAGVDDDALDAYAASLGLSKEALRG
jgi:ATP-dependent protease ClpP protease subunit